MFKKLLKILYRTLFALLLLLAVAAICWTLYVPRIVEGKLIEALRQAGMQTASLHVGYVDPDRAGISDLDLGSDHRLTVDSARVTYDISDAAKGRIKTLRVTGLRLRVGYHDGAIDLGELAAFHGSSSPAPLDIPLDRVDLRASMILLELPGRTFSIPVQGSVTRSGPQALDIDLQATLADRSLRITGLVNLAGGAVDAPDIHITASVPRVVASGSLALSAVDVDAHLALKSDEKQLAATLKPGASAVMQSASGTLEGIRVAPVAPADATPAQTPAITLKLGDKPAVFTLDRKSAAWHADAPDVALAVAPVDVTLLRQQISAQSISLAVRFSADASPAGFSVALVEPAKFTANALTLPIGERGVRFDNTNLTLAAPPNSKLFDSSAAGGSRVALSVSADKPLNLTGEEATGIFDTMSATLAVNLPTKGPTSIESELTLGNGSLTCPPAGIVAKGIDLRLPIRINAAKPAAPGKLDVHEFTLGRDTLPPISGAASLSEGRLDVASDWELAPKIVAHLTGDIGAQESRFTVKLPATNITDAQTVGKLFSLLKPVDLTGTVSIDGEATLRGGRLDPNIHVELKDVDLGASQWQAKAEGVSGGVTFTNLAPLSSPDAQQLTSRKVTFGKFEFKQGDLQFRLVDTQKLFVERARFQLGDSGNFLTHAILVDFTKPDVEAEVFIEDVNLGDWLSILTSEKIVGPGQLYGRVPVKFHPKEHDMVTLGPGFIYAKPGGGTLTVGDPKLVASLIDRADPALSGDANFAQIKVKAYEALSDFEYSLFSFDIVPEGDTVMLRVETRGKGRKGENPLEVGSLVVNVRGIEEAVNELLFVKKKLTPGG